MSNIKVHWLHSKGPEVCLPLLAYPDRESICIDNDPGAEAILRLTLDYQKIIPDENIRIHLWALKLNEILHYFFLDDSQNHIIKQGCITACQVNT